MKLDAALLDKLQSGDPQGMEDAMIYLEEYCQKEGIRVEDFVATFLAELGEDKS